jgi:hypothetical protein
MRIRKVWAIQEDTASQLFGFVQNAIVVELTRPLQRFTNAQCNLPRRDSLGPTQR